MSVTRLAVEIETSEGAPAGGEALTLETIYRAHGAYVARVAFRVLGRRDEVDDLVQEVFVIAMGGLERLREPAAVRGWLATITVRTARRQLRLRKLRSWLFLDDATSYESVAAPGASPEQRALLAKMYALLDR